jgi:citrate lyase beta subunit
MSDDIQRPLRSALFVPADKPRALEKAPGLKADALILDLEDAVAPDAKPAARLAAPAAIAGFKAGGSLAALRIGEPGSPALAADIDTVAEACPDVVVVAKVETCETLGEIRERLDTSGWSGPLWAMVETPRGVLNLARLGEAASSLGLSALVAGSNDLAAALRLPAGPTQRPALIPHLAQIILAARAGGLQVLDGVYNAYQDADGFAREVAEGRALGFDGKTLIHPSQVAPANTAFAPGPAEQDWARQVVEAFENPDNSGKGAIPVAGQMVEAMHLTAARAILAATR